MICSLHIFYMVFLSWGACTRLSRSVSWPLIVTNLYVRMIKKVHRADRWSIQGDPFLIGFSAEHKWIRGNVWTTIFTDSSIRQIGWNWYILDDHYCLANQFEFKDSPEYLKHVQTSEHSGHGSVCGSARSFIRTFRLGLSVVACRSPQIATAR